MYKNETLAVCKTNKMIKISLYFIILYLLIPKMRVVFGAYSLIFFIFLFYFTITLSKEKVIYKMINVTFFIFVFIIIYVYATKPNDLLRSVLSQLLFWFPIIIAYYIVSSDDIVLKKNIIGLIIICLSITALTTIIGLEITPMASRELATGNNKSYDLYEYSSRNIGGYGFTYSLVLFIPTIIYLFKKKRQFIYIIILTLFLICIIKTQYTIALIFTIFSLLLFFTKFSSRSIFIMLIVTILLFLLFNKSVAYFLLDITTNMQSKMLRARLREIAKIILYDETTGDMGNRIMLYFNSFVVFLKNPIIGTIFNRKDTYYIGGHSQNFDLLAFTGLVGFTYYIKQIKKIFNVLKSKISDSEYKICFIYTFLSFILLGFINTTNFPELTIVVFLATSGLNVFSETTNDYERTHSNQRQLIDIYGELK